MTLNQRFRWDGLRGLRLFAGSERAHRHSDRLSLGQNVGTRHIAVPLANTTEGEFSIPPSFLERDIDLVGERTNPVVDPFLALRLLALQPEQVRAEVERCLQRDALE